jgi:hypothetical protein
MDKLNFRIDIYEAQDLHDALTVKIKIDQQTNPGSVSHSNFLNERITRNDKLRAQIETMFPALETNRIILKTIQ